MPKPKDESLTVVVHLDVDDPTPEGAAVLIRNVSFEIEVVGRLLCAQATRAAFVSPYHPSAKSLWERVRAFVQELQRVANTFEQIPEADRGLFPRK